MEVQPLVFPENLHAGNGMVEIETVYEEDRSLHLIEENPKKNPTLLRVGANTTQGVIGMV